MENNSQDNTKFDSLLILNSDKSLIKGLTVALLDYFCEIRTTSNPNEAISFLDNKTFSTIISGTDFKTEDGLNIIKKLREKNPFAKLLIVSAPMENNTRSKVERLNIQKIYEKPFELNEIIFDIKQMFN